MTYLGQLTSQLRYKNYSTTEIVEILQDVRSHAAESGTAPDESFGDAQEYPKQKKVTAFKAVMNVAYAVVLIGWAVAFFVLRLALPAGSMPRPWVIGVVVLIGIVVVSVVGQLYSRRVPRLRR